MNIRDDRWGSFIADLLASFPELVGYVTSEKNVSPWLLFSKFRDIQPELAFDPQFKYDIPSDEVYGSLVRTLLQGRFQEYVWIINDRIECSPSGPVRVDTCNLLDYVSQYSENNDNWAMFDGDFIVLCPRTKTLGMVLHDGGGSLSIVAPVS